MKRRVALVALLGMLCGAARAEIMVASSIEWLTCTSEVVAVGKIEKITITKGVHSVIYEDCVVQVDEVLKGDMKGKKLTFCLRTLSANPTAKAFMNSKEGVLLFLSKSKDHGRETHLDNKYVPRSKHLPFSVIDLSNPPKDVFSKEMNILTDKDKILRIVRKWSTSAIAYSVDYEVPFDSPIHQRLYAGSACYLWVPAEEKYRSHFMKLAQSPRTYERVKAASELYKFPGKESEAVLRELLKDQTENYWYSAADAISKVEFSVRVAAYRSLKALGKPVPEMVLERKPTREEQRELRHNYWRKSFKLALPDGWKVVSVEDGKTRTTSLGDRTVVVVACKSSSHSCKFTLIPKEWAKQDLPTSGHLGINGQYSQGARHFFLDGALPKDAKTKVIRYFGLEKSKGSDG